MPIFAKRTFNCTDMRKTGAENNKQKMKRFVLVKSCLFKSTRSSMFNLGLRVGKFRWNVRVLVLVGNTLLHWKDQPGTEMQMDS